MVDVRAGIYRHYKGNLYLVQGVAQDSSIEDRLVVVYVGLELDGASLGPRTHVREIVEFHQKVCGKPTHVHYGMMNVHGACLTARFTFLGPVLTQRIIDAQAALRGV